MTLPKHKEETLAEIVEHLKVTENIEAIVLGGSHAIGKATATSDLDIGIYYYDEKPFKIEDIRSIAKKYAITEPTVTGFYEWGRWVNGGAWIETAAGKIDLLYKNIDQIKSTIELAKKGHWENDFEQQPPYGFSSIIYLGETQACVPLYDPNEIISKMKTEIQPYPSKLKEKVIQYSLWPAEFTIWHADYFCAKNDFYNVSGCLTRAAKNIVTALFAINELYPLGDKRAIEILEDATTCPPRLKERIETIVCINRDDIRKSVETLKGLFAETTQLANAVYQPFYKLPGHQNG